MIGSCNCPITANCPTTTLQINQSKNTTVYAPITFEEIVTVMIKSDTSYLISDKFRTAISDTLVKLSYSKLAPRKHMAIDVIFVVPSRFFKFPYQKITQSLSSRYLSQALSQPDFKVSSIKPATKKTKSYFKLLQCIVNI